MVKLSSPSVIPTRRQFFVFKNAEEATYGFILKERKSAAEICVAAIRNGHCGACATEHFNAGNRGSTGMLCGRGLLEGALHAGLPWH